MRFASLLLVFASAWIAIAADRTPVRFRGLGGSGVDSVSAITLDAQGNVCIAGTTSSFDFPVENAAQAANRGSQLMMTNDSGATWQPLHSSPSGLFVQQLVADPSDANVVWATDNQVLYKTADAGATWTTSFLPSRDAAGMRFFNIRTFAIDRQQPSTVYIAAGSAPLVARTRDGGATWTFLDLAGFFDQPQAGLYDVAADPFRPGTVWVSGFTGVLRSEDYGDTWRRVQFGTDQVRILFDQGAPGSVRLAGNKLYNSTDAGETFRMTPNSLYFPWITADPSRPGVLYAGSDNHLYSSSDGGVTWQRLSDRYVNSVPFPDPNTGVIIAGLLRSPDGGNTWGFSALSRGPFSIAFAPSRRGRAYASVPTSSDAFIAKLTPDMNTVLWATYLGGQGEETASSIVTDPAGNIYVAGTTNSADFPITANPAERTYSGLGDAFVAKYDAAGRQVWATFVGGSNADAANALALEADGSVLVAGTTGSFDFPLGGTPDTYPQAFVLRLTPGGEAFARRTLFPGRWASPQAIGLDPLGGIAVAGTLQPLYMAEFKTTADAWQPAARGGADGFFARLDSSLNITYATFLGGRAEDTVSGMAMDAAGNAYVVGSTQSNDFPTTEGAYQRALGASCPYPAYSASKLGDIYRYDDLFVSKLDRSGKPVYSTYIGSECQDDANGMAIDAAGGVWVTGATNSGRFPMLAPVESGAAYHDFKGVLVRLSPDGSRLTSSSYVSTQPAKVAAIAVDSVITAGGVGRSAFTPGVTYPGGIQFQAIDFAPPQLTLNAVGNAFTVLDGPVAPGEIVLLQVSGLPTGIGVDRGLNPPEPLSTEAAGVRVLFDGTAAPVMQVSPWTIYAVVPDSVRERPSTTVQFAFGGALSNPVLAEVRASSLGLLTLDAVSGRGRANARNEDGSANAADNPAAKGSLITLFFTGRGDRTVSTQWLTDEVVSPMEGFVAGLHRITGRVPASGASGERAIFITDGVSVSPALTVSIR